MAGWCPCQHPEGVPVHFTIHEMPEGWAIDFCDFGHMPSEIWAASDRPRDPGEDDGKKPGIIERYRCALTIESMYHDPSPREYLLTAAKTGHGVLTRGQAFMLAARGGSGKSNMFMQLCVAVASGTNWFGAGRGWAAQQGRVLVIFAEEDLEEVMRRLHYAIKAAGLLASDADLQSIRDNLVLLPMRGETCTLCQTMDRKGLVGVTERAIEILDELKKAAIEKQPFSLVLLDPLARFAGADVETDNAAGTKFCEVIERFTKADCGRPAVGVSHHLRKRGMNDDESTDVVRGSSSIVNGFRWLAVVGRRGRDKHAMLRVLKTNYGSIPEPLAVAPVDGCEGMMVAIEPPAKEAGGKNGAAASDMDLMNRLHDEIEAHGPDSGRHLARRVKAGNLAAAAALDDMVASGRLVKLSWRYALPPTCSEPVPEHVPDLFPEQDDHDS